MQMLGAEHSTQLCACPHNLSGKLQKEMINGKGQHFQFFPGHDWIPPLPHWILLAPLRWRLLEITCASRPHNGFCSPFPGQFTEGVRLEVRTDPVSDRAVETGLNHSGDGCFLSSFLVQSIPALPSLRSPSLRDGRALAQPDASFQACLLFPLGLSNQQTDM